MKIINNILLSVVVLLAIVACNNTENQVQALVDEFNKELPIEYGSELVLEKCKFDKQNVIYIYKLPEVSITPEEAEELKATIFNEETLADEQLMYMLTLLAEGGYGLVYDYSDYKNNSIAISFSPQEIKEIIDRR